MLVLCNGSYADSGGRRVLNCGTRVRYAEVLSSARGVDLFSSDREHVTAHAAKRSGGKRRIFCAGPRPRGDGRLVMCGICGVFYSDRTRRVDHDTLVAMNQQIVHRGPDDDGFLLEANVGLAMRRLSIIDIQTGHQPISNEDGKVWIVFNGEIYNHLDLRRDLESRVTAIAQRATRKPSSICTKNMGASASNICAGCLLSRSGTAAREACSLRVIGWASSLSTIASMAELCCSARKSKRFSPILA